ncbi:hypothetical protein BDZ89DRAFT_1061401 [Hymenopellis radicata]|nr:hypothetical protein BDZ89DRAFT_1061401 [Hymenopellis radicata]
MHGSPSTSTPSRRSKSSRFTTPTPVPQQTSFNNSSPSKFPDASEPTFYSCISIPVEGAVPIEAEPVKPAKPPQSEPADQKRAPRKSKTDALAALKERDIPQMVERDDSEPPDILAERYQNVAPIPVPSTLDLSTVRTTSPRHYRPPENISRPFDLEECPSYYPTFEEFKDPMAYVKSIADQARSYGICKIVPPEGWKMPFVTDTETFRFKTRLQRLNSIEAASRAKINFLEQLYRFHKQQGNPRVVVPTINHKPMDLWLLKKEVNKMGGYEAVSRDKRWADLGRLLGYRGIQGLTTQIKQSYMRIILPYERFCEQKRNGPQTPSVKPPSSGLFKAEAPTDGLPPISPLTPPSPLSEPSVDSDDEAESPVRPRRVADSEEEVDSPLRPRRSKRVVPDTLSTAPKSSIIAPTPAELPAVIHDKVKVKSAQEAHCEICFKDNEGTQMLLCDGCDCGYHTFCLTPKVKSIPKGAWYCHACLSGSGRDFGFDEGDEHTLSSFQARDREFRRFWFESHPPQRHENAMDDVDDPAMTRIGNLVLSEADVEKEFWRLVENPNETVEIEYGADVHSTTHGSGMPSIELHPLDPYAKDPWNLNNIPIVSDSLLRFIKSDISGMTVPWTYVGMTFSTFFNVLSTVHWGETKSWYGIPGEDAAKFEAAMKSEAPDLFEAQPDLLFQLVTLMNPDRVKKAGVRVYSCNQRAGEFVITFPKSYHAGFNHGLNFNEAVNFALPDWLPYGRDCVQRYREHSKLPVFSHDELLITITQQSQSIKTAIWLLDKMSDRRKARELGLTEILEEEDRPEEQYQCAVCKAFCYLSQQVVCAEHRASYTLRTRFSDDELQDIETKVSERAAVPTTWQAKLGRLLSDSPRPALRSLRALLAEGERISFYLPELTHLRKCVTKANEWVDEANSFIVRKQSRKRARRSRGRAAEEEDKPERTLDDLYEVLNKVDQLGFDCPEITSLQNLANQAEEVKRQANALISTDDEGDFESDDFIEKCKRLLLEGSSLNVLLEELVRVEQVVERVSLTKELQEMLDDPEVTMTLEEVRQLLTRTRACNMPVDDKYVQLLERRQQEGNSWDDRAKNILAQPIKTIEELDAFADLDSSIPIDPTVLDRLMQSRAKAKDFEKQALAWLQPDADATKPRPQDVMRLVTRAEKDFKIAAVQDLKATAQIAVDLEIRCDQVVHRKYRKSPNEDLFATLQQWRKYTRDHLHMFNLSAFEALEVQLERHGTWLKELPWYNEGHGQPEGQAVLEDVLECTRPNDDIPPGDEFFTCICNLPVRPPPAGIVSDAVQCDYCFARFHGECAKNGGSCPFCDHQHWNGEIRKERNWHFCFLPDILERAPNITRTYSNDYKNLQTIIHRVDRLSASIGQFLSYTAQPVNQRPDFIHQVRHYMRKLYKIQFAVSPNPDVSFGLDLAQLHRILASRPHFQFGQDLDVDWSDGTRCICRGRTLYLLNYATVECEGCAKLYHAGCVFFPQDQNSTTRKKFTCPLCCLRKGTKYAYAEVRVKPLLDTSANAPVAPELYVDTETMLEQCSKKILYKKLPPPWMATLFVELARVVSGNSNPPDVFDSPLAPDTIPLPPSRSPHTSSRGVLPPPRASSSSILPVSPPSVTLPPPPPWQRWGSVNAVTGRPPPSRGSDSSLLLDVAGSRKRKEYDYDVEMSSSSSSKRRSPAPERPPSQSHGSPTLPPIHPHPPAVQTLSPSLAMIMSPQTVPYSPKYESSRSVILDKPSSKYGSSSK